MLKKIYIQLTTFVTALMISTLCFAQLTLQEVFEAAPDVAAFTASDMAFHATKENVVRTIGGKRWEVRYFTFTDGKKSLPEVSFKEMIARKGLLDMKAKSFAVNPYLTTWTFTQNEDLKNESIYFTLSLREIND